MSQPTILLPGDTIDSSLIPTSQKRRIHPSIKQVQIQSDNTTQQPTQTYIATATGTLHTDLRKKLASITTPRARYVPQPGDLVIAQVRQSSQEHFHVSLSPFGAQAVLPHLAFEGATKKTRPQLRPGDLVYAKVVSATKGMDVEISCVNPATGKSEPDGLGPLGVSSSSSSSAVGSGAAGSASASTSMAAVNYVFDVSVGFAERLLRREGVGVVMEELGKKIPGGFEIAVGRNGRVWVSCPEAGPGGCIAVSKVLKEVDELVLTEKEQKSVVGRIANSVLAR